MAFVLVSVFQAFLKNTQTNAVDEGLLLNAQTTPIPRGRQFRGLHTEIPFVGQLMAHSNADVRDGEGQTALRIFYA